VTVIEVPDPVATLRAVLISRVVDTDLEDVQIKDARQDGDEPPFGILAEGGDTRARSGGAMLPSRVSLSLTAVTAGQAARLWRLASAALHGAGPIRILVDGEWVGVWRIFDETGLQRPVQEPDTAWWRAFGVFDVYMADRAIG